MDLVTPLMNTLRQGYTNDLLQAQAQDTQAMAQQRMLGVQLGQLRMNQESQASDALRNALAGQPQMDQSLLPSPTDSQVSAARKAVQRLQFEAAQTSRIADAVIRQTGDPKVADTWRDNATTAMHRVTQAQRELAQEQANLAKQTASIAGSVSDEPSWKVAYPRLVALDPELAKSLLLDRDTTGAPVYGPQTQRTMSSLGQMALTEEQRQNLKLKADDDARKSQEAAIRQADEKRKEKLTDARVALLHAQTYKARREPEAKAKSVAVKPATSADRNAAASAIDAEFEGAKFSPGSREKMAADVADRARKIFADAAASGNSIGMEEARDQAMEELKPFVTDKTVVIKEPMDILGYKVGGESQSYKVYTKGVTKPAQTGAGVSTVTTQEQYDALKPGATYVGPDGKRYVKRVTKPAQTGAGVPTVTTQEQYDALKPGATYVGPDGKRYVKRG